MSNIRLLGLMAALAGWFISAVPVWAGAGGLPLDKTLVVLDLGMAGDLSDSGRNAEWQQRRSRMSELLREKLNGGGLYAVVDRDQTLRAVEDSGISQPLYACNGCELDIAKRLNAQYVLFGWVSRVSNLVLALNVEIKDVASGRTILQKGLDFRGDNDQGWARAIDYFVKNLKERRT